MSRYLDKTPIGEFLLFGKHAGEKITEVPLDYLRWCLREIKDAPDEFHTSIRKELDRRRHEGVGSLDFEECLQ